jgi:Tfp pilus assembly protein PilF
VKRKYCILSFLCALAVSCGTGTEAKETPLPIRKPEQSVQAVQPRTAEGGIVDKIRSAAEKGTPSSLQNGLRLIRDKELGANDFGRVMNAVITTLMQKVYPNTTGQRLLIPLSELPQAYPYAKILREVSLGNYAEPPRGSQDYLEYVLPFLALLDSADERKLLRTLPHLNQARELNPDSVLAPYFTGLVYERAGRSREAADAYRRAYGESAECYPAALGLVRLMHKAGQKQEALWILQDLVMQFPDNMTIKRELALGYYLNQDWSRAESAIQEILQRNSRDGALLLMYAHALTEQGQFLKAASSLDRYAAIDTAHPLYLFLRARAQAEAYHNPDAALNYLRSMLSRPNISDEITAYTAGLLLESSRPEDQQEGRELLKRLLEAPAPALPLIETAFKDAVRREAWAEAKTYLPRLLAEGPPAENLLRAYAVEKGLGNKEAALKYARELYEQEPTYDEGILAYIAGLIDLGRTREAGALIESRLASPGVGPVKAQYYYQRSRIQSDEEAVLQDLRSSLFADPRNNDALLGLLELYHRRGDDRRALYYYKQAQSFDPANPRLRYYDRYYAE